MSNAKIASKTPFAVEVQAGEKYFWCSCGRSDTQPFCDGSHKGTEFAPVQYRPEADGRVFFCGCKQTGTPPLCDGSHAQL